MSTAGRPALGLVLALVAAIGLVTAKYLLVHDSGTEAACVIGGGCSEVASSKYSHVGGIPVAVCGIAWSAVALVAALAWWWSRDRLPLMILYIGGLAAVVVEAYLLYLQLRVIEAVCSWCALYGATVVVGWLGAAVGVTRTSGRPKGTEIDSVPTRRGRFQCGPPEE